jgi:hypothetical protein
VSGGNVEGGTLMRTGDEAHKVCMENQGWHREVQPAK